MALLEVKNVKKIYTTRFGGNKVEALRDVNFSVEPGEYVAIMGESGSGKSTLLNILAQLDRPTSGKVILKGRDLSTIKEKEMSAFRRQRSCHCHTLLLSTRHFVRVLFQNFFNTKMPRDRRKALFHFFISSSGQNQWQWKSADYQAADRSGR